jgi:hypothetical protein
MQPHLYFTRNTRIVTAFSDTKSVRSHNKPFVSERYAMKQYYT